MDCLQGEILPFYANGRESMVLDFYSCRGEVIADRRHALEAYGSFFNQ